MTEQYCIECNKEIINPPPQSKNKAVQGLVCPHCLLKENGQIILIRKGWQSHSNPSKECKPQKEKRDEYDEIIDLGNNCHLRIKKTLKKLKRRI